MALSVDTRKVMRAKVVPWEQGQWGVAWETSDGRQGADFIGSQEQAQATVAGIHETHPATLASAVVRLRQDG